MIQELKLQNNIGISFLNKFSIINSKIKEIFQNIFNLESEDKYMIPTNCLKDKNDIYIFYKLKETFLINIGNFDTNLIYDTKILLEIDNKEYFKDIINKGINNEIESVITSLIKYYKDCIIIEDINKNKKGIAYKINIKLPKPESNMRKLFDPCNKQKDKNLNQNSNNNINNIFVNNNYFSYSNNQNNNMNQNQKNVINPLLEKDIKIIIKYILFHSKLEKYLNASKNKGFYKIIHNCYLINHAWMQTYQFYLFYNDLKKLAEIELKNVTPMPSNNMQKEKDFIYPEYLINVIYAKFIKNFSKPFEKTNLEQVSWNIEHKKFEISISNEHVRGAYVKYPSIFEIVDENIYNDLVDRIGNKMNNDYSKTNIIINDGNIIIKCDEIHKKEKTNLIMLIGNLEQNKLFHLTSLLNFYGEEQRNSFYNSFQKYNKQKCLELYKDYINKRKIEEMVFNEKYMRDKMIKLFVIMYLSNDVIKEKLSKDIKSNGTCNYYLINKEWMKIYRDYYDYKNLCNLLDKNIKQGGNFAYHKKKIIDNFIENKSGSYDCWISGLIENIPIEILRSMESKKLNQKDLVKNLKISNNKQNNLAINKVEYLTSQSKLNYYGENEIINSELYKLFNEIESDLIKKNFQEKCEKITCYIGENKLFIMSEFKLKYEYHLLNVGCIESLIFKPFLLIYYYDLTNFNKMIVDFINEGFSNFIEKFNLIENTCLEIKDPINKQNFGKICKINNLPEEIKKIIEKAHIINSESMKLLNLILYLKSFNNELNNSTINPEQKLGYLVKKEFIEKIQELESYILIDNYISTNEKIQNTFKTISNLELSIPLIKKEFTLNKIKEINSKKQTIEIKSNDFNVDLKKLILDENNKVDYANNFYILNKDIYNSFKSSSFFSFVNNYNYKYVVLENRIFMLYNKNTIHIYKNNENVLDLELILWFDNNERDYVLEEIQRIGFKQYLEYLLFDNDYVSPLFNKEQKKIGTAYKYSQTIPDYSKIIINFNMRKIFVLYLNYFYLFHPKTITKFQEYYIVNKKWIQEYKKYYDFDKIYEEIDKNENIKNIFKTLKENEEITDKKLTLMIKKLPKNMIYDFNEKDKNFMKNYKNTNVKIPDISGLNYQDLNGNDQPFYYTNNFEIINKKIYEEFFKSLDKDIEYESDKKSYVFSNKTKVENKEGKAEIIFDKKRIIVKIEDNQNPGFRTILHIGQLDPSLTFQQECFLLYENSTLMLNHRNYLKEGYNDFCEKFMKEPINTKELIINNQNYGLAVKKVQNPDWIEKFNDGDLISQYFKSAPKVGLSNIGATCYMNATLQCFCQIEEFSSYFKYNKYINKVKLKYEGEKKLCLSSSFQKLIREIWPQSLAKSNSKERRSYKPNEFRQKIADMSPLFVNNQANDAKDLVNFIIMTLHEELNMPIQNNQNNNDSPINQYDMSSILKNFWIDYQHNFRSKISELFYAIQQTHTTCTRCNNVQYNFQAYFFLVFPLEEVKKHAINQIMNSVNNNNMMGMNFNQMNNGMNMMNFNNNMNNMSMMNNNINNGFNNMNAMNMNISNINNQMNNLNNQMVNMSNQMGNINGQMNNMNNQMYQMNNMNNQMNQMGNMNSQMNDINNQMNNMNNQISQNNQMNNQINQINMNNQINQMNIQNNQMNMNNQINQMNMNSMNNQMNNMGMNNPNMNQPMNINNMMMMNSINNMGMNNMNNNINNMNMNSYGMMNNFNNPSNMNNVNIINIMNINNFNMANNNMKLQKLNNNIVDIYDCFNFNQKVDKFVGKDQIYCNYCQCLTDANYMTYLTTSPKILILLLNRGVGIQFKIKLEFTTELDISPYVMLGNNCRKYKLIGVITHLGESGASGHFIAHCLSPADKKWYTYNDDIVSECVDFKKNIIDLGMPYLLFYQRSDTINVQNNNNIQNNNVNNIQGK